MLQYSQVDPFVPHHPHVDANGRIVPRGCTGLARAFPQGRFRGGAVRLAERPLLELRAGAASVRARVVSAELAARGGARAVGALDLFGTRGCSAPLGRADCQEPCDNS